MVSDSTIFIFMKYKTENTLTARIILKLLELLKTAKILSSNYTAIKSLFVFSTHFIWCDFVVIISLKPLTWLLFIKYWQTYLAPDATCISECINFACNHEMIIIEFSLFTAKKTGEIITRYSLVSLCCKTLNFNMRIHTKIINLTHL